MTDGATKAKGRPSKLTAELAELLTAAIGEGKTLKAAAEGVGVSPRTVHRWLKRGRSEEGTDHAKLASLYDEALEEQKQTLIDNVMSGTDMRGNPDWRASAWMLERRHPKEFAKRTIKEHIHHEVQQGIEEVIFGLRDFLSREDYRKVLDALDRQRERAAAGAGAPRRGQSH